MLTKLRSRPSEPAQEAHELSTGRLAQRILGVGGRSTAGEIAEAAWSRFTSLDQRVVGLLRRVALPALRISLGVVFVWFGALKIAGVTPVADLVAAVVYWVDAAWLVPGLGVGEVLIGTGLILGRGLRAVLLLLALQLLGTFLVPVLLPEVAFTGGNPLLLTVEGEFVVKNLVLLSAGLALGARLRPGPPLVLTISTEHAQDSAAPRTTRCAAPIGGGATRRGAPGRGGPGR